MGEIAALTEGFSPGNRNRIYHGRPALHDRSLPVNILSPRQFEVTTHIVDGMTYEEIASDSDLSMSTVRTHAHDAFSRLGILARSQLAGFFPLPEVGEVDDLELADHMPTGLDILQALSVGRHNKHIAMDRGIRLSTIRSHMNHARKIWGMEGADSLVLLRAANAVRARYVQAVEASPDGAELGPVHDFTLPRLARLEPVIRRDFLVPSSTGIMPALT